MDGALMHRLPDAERTRTLGTDELRSAFLVGGLFTPGRVTLRHVDLDRVVLGGAVPLEAPLTLDPPVWLAADHFLERRELGVLNIGGAGRVSAGGARFDLQRRDVVYLGRGTRDVSFASVGADDPARFYLVSYPAHASHPAARVTRDDADQTALGGDAGANKRSLAKYIHPGRVQTSQLLMGVTTLATGSVWNTMPSHRHIRRTEVYLYFDVPQNDVVIHLLGEPGETRHVVVRNEEVVLSPAWSVHSGCGTSAYSFCWAMGGENQDFADMQAVDMRELK
jgi:4-deoxy-L-threo-5-hexosulose-uronate ketol-isomerase